MDLTGYFIHAPLSALYTLLLGFGMTIVFDNIGRAIFKQTELWVRAMYFFSGLLVTSWLVLLLSISGWVSVPVLKMMSLGFIGLGIFFFIRGGTFFLKDILLRFPAVGKALFSKIILFAVYATLVCFLVIALAPPTDADSLDYHLGVPVEILRTGSLWFNKDLLQFRLTGFGEMLNLLGVANGCPQLSALLQVISLLWLMGIYADAVPGKSKDVLLALMLGIPVLLFLIPNQKNQLTGVICTCVCFYGIASRYAQLKSNVFLLFIWTLVFAIGIKYSFALSAAVILFFLFAKDQDIELPPKQGGNFVLWCIVFLGPLYAYKLIHYGDPLSPMLEELRPNPDAVVANFARYIQQFSDSDYPFPVNLFLPSSIGNISAVLGWSAVILLMFLTFYKSYLREVCCIALFFLLTILFGQKTPRFFIEPYLWILPFFVIKAASSKWSKYLLVPGQLQFLLLLPFFFFAASIFLPGILSDKGREKVMQQYAYGYSESRWINKVIPKGETVISFRYSKSLIEPVVFPKEYLALTFGKGATDTSKIKKMFTEYKARYIVLRKEEAKRFRQYYNFELVAGPQEFYKATRNKYNRRAYELGLYKLNLQD